MVQRRNDAFDPTTDIHAAEDILSCVTIELVLLPASAVLGIVHIIMSHLQERKGLAIGRVGGNRRQRVIVNAAALQTGLNLRPLASDPALKGRTEEQLLYLNRS